MGTTTAKIRQKPQWREKEKRRLVTESKPVFKRLSCHCADFGIAKSLLKFTLKFQSVEANRQQKTGKRLIERAAGDGHIEWLAAVQSKCSGALGEMGTKWEEQLALANGPPVKWVASCCCLDCLAKVSVKNFKNGQMLLARCCCWWWWWWWWCLAHLSTFKLWRLFVSTACLSFRPFGSG